jgi:hypothetical protein
MRLRKEISELQEELLRKDSVLRRYEQEEKSKAEREITVKEMQDMELENELLKSEITHNKAELSRIFVLLRHQEMDLRRIHVLKADLQETKQTTKRMTIEVKRRKAESQIMLKKMQNMEIKNESLKLETSRKDNILR